MILACQLIKAFVGTTNFNHSVTIYAEISTLVASILHLVSCRSQLIGKECFTHRTNLWFLGTERIQQVGVVKIYLIWFLKICNSFQIGK